jgi:hypothetical protein
VSRKDPGEKAWPKTGNKEVLSGQDQPLMTPEQLLAEHREMYPLSPQPKRYASTKGKAARRDADQLQRGRPVPAPMRKLKPVMEASGFAFYAVSDRDGKYMAKLLRDLAHLQCMDQGLAWAETIGRYFRAALAVKDGHVAAVAVAGHHGQVETHLWGQPIPERGISLLQEAWTVRALWAAKRARYQLVQETLLRTLAQNLGIEASTLAFDVRVAAHNEALVKAVSPVVLRLRW